MTRIPYVCEMDALQRDGLPYENEPDTGSCWNCDHMVEVTLDGKVYPLCVRERDNGSSGDVYEADPTTRDCEGWDDYSA